MRKMIGLSLGVLVVAVSGCSTVRSMTQGQPTVDESQLAGVPADQMEAVQQARQELADAQRREQQAREIQEQTKQQRDLAKTQLDSARSELKSAQAMQQMGAQSSAEQDKEDKDVQAEDEPGTAPLGSGPEERTGYPQDSQDPQVAPEQGAPRDPQQTGAHSLETAQAKVNAGEALVKYMDSLDKVRGRQVSMASAEVEFAKAKLEATKFEVASRSGSAQPIGKEKDKGPTRADFDKAVADAQSKIASRRAELLEAQADAAQKYSAWTTLDRALPAGARERVEVPAPPRG